MQGKTDVKQPLFCIMPTRQTIPFVFDSPHSGTVYPEDFDHCCDRYLLQQTADSYVDELFSGAPAAGAPLLAAHFPRCYVDVNRAETDIDLELLPEGWEGEVLPTMRSHLGVGLIHRLCRPNLTTKIYDRRLTAEELRNRIDNYYHPYHDQLGALIDATHAQFGVSWHINCHSMPSTNAVPDSQGKQERPDFVLGNRDDGTCGPDFVRFVQEVLRDMNYSVAVNKPYKGAELVERHSDPGKGRSSLQIEINRRLYMNEDTLQKHGGYYSLKDDLDTLIARLADYGCSYLTGLAAD